MNRRGRGGSQSIRVLGAARKERGAIGDSEFLTPDTENAIYMAFP